MNQLKIGLKPSHGSGNIRQLIVPTLSKNNIRYFKQTKIKVKHTFSFFQDFLKINNFHRAYCCKNVPIHLLFFRAAIEISKYI